MTLYQEIKKELKGFGKTNDYFRDWLFSKVSGHYTIEPKPGQMLFFSYYATTNRLEYFDKYPLVMVTETMPDHFVGGNLHYVSPILRPSLGKSFKTGDMSFPLKMYHKYLKVNVNSPLFVIDETEWADIGLIPVESFVNTQSGKSVAVSSSRVWNES
jgi:hypothetical protein